MMDLPAVKATGVNDKPIKFSKRRGGRDARQTLSTGKHLALFTSSAPRPASAASQSAAAAANCCRVS